MREERRSEEDEERSLEVTHDPSFYPEQSEA
eukprot:CAMPEP_0174363454 /NCGR_PEP_ID=MMETSP0811_2-20130205/68898_1 /TAXON_ID=73025 ORGANISM="Eutreptiella gymnastica-like, Strain CCMP1594" /NCGR_SAMPLE_ID=MMETSP0811_2 /ASSEMBLY_ACC=CAM_ASM_000667 /LENGTH=30 /DNA_ID= /DNA_START= /DNA_END= /DNA_ORIENTATION=